VCRAAEPAGEDSQFATDQLVAWCIVPFDAKNRTPGERADMLKRLGITRLAYDWRAEHVPSFEEEILSLRKAGIEFFAFWAPASRSAGYRKMMDLIEQYDLHPQIWMIAPSAPASTQQQRVAANAGALVPFVQDALRLDCKFALYNHGGWSGQPENLIAMTRWLRQRLSTEDVGIVYNFHHGHEHLDQFPEAFNKMVPYLFCVNLNGMKIGGPKILPVGQGDRDQQMLQTIQNSDYRGPIGILDHRAELDAERSLRQNIEGLQRLLKED
jgi:sugar phosphate isomerase/epimerase